ncbi:hypothetical protein Tco_0801548 [Tanacetum coccineum]|uniref:Reverse transcriptase domain-containing protein n=1 Tax=Tanacetum coccineum TaxID=301880 RepID=A0ABQ4ZX69_9ASTR
MRTRSQSRRRRQQQTLPVVENFELEDPNVFEQNGCSKWADNRTMAQMLQAPIEGYEDAIVIPPINANNFELKQPLINLVQSNKFTGRQESPQSTFDFNKVNSQRLDSPEVPNTCIPSYQCNIITIPSGDISRILEALPHTRSVTQSKPKEITFTAGIQKDLKVVEPKTSSVEYATSYEPKVEIPEVELKELPPHLEYAFLEENNKLPVIISKYLSQEEKTSLIHVLKNRKQAIAWKLSDIKGIDPEFCSHKILLEDDYQPSVQHQRRVNPKIHDVIKKEVEKLLDAGLIYPISDSPWVSPVHCVPKKGGMTVVTNEENELVPTRLVTGWRVCIDYRKLNEATCKDHFPLPFMDQMLERLAGNEFYCFLDGFSGYFQIPIDPKDQEKTTFTCP